MSGSLYPGGQPLSGYDGWAPSPLGPGGVPLRPLGVGEILNGAFALIRRDPVATLGASAIIAVLSAVLTTPLSWAAAQLTKQLPARISPQTQPNQATEALFHLIVGVIPILMGTLLVSFAGLAVLTALLTAALGRTLIGDHITIAQAWRIARMRRVLAVTALMALIFWIALPVPVLAIVALLAAAHLAALAAYIVFVGGIGTVGVEIWMYIRLLMAIPAIVLECERPSAALRRSWNLVGGSWWRTFGIFLLTYIMVQIINVILRLPFNLISLLIAGWRSGNVLSGLLGPGGPPTVATLFIGAIAGIVALTCTAPISATVIGLLYADVRMRKEGLDLSLQQAGQAGALTGREFADLWRPGLPEQTQRYWAGPPGQGPWIRPPGQGY